MSGTKFAFDTNALINFLKGDPFLKVYTNASVVISVISVIEYLSYPQMTDEGQQLLFSFLKKVELIELQTSNTQHIQLIAGLRKSFRIKLPDAIIAATAIWKNAILITKDRDFSKINSLHVTSY